MARPTKGHESVDLAKALLQTSDSPREIHVCLAVILPTEHGISIKETAALLGRSTRWVNNARNAFIEQGISKVSDNYGGRRKANMSIAEEAAFINSLLDGAKTGGIVVVSKIHLELERVLARKVHRSVVYKLLHRHGWRKIAPRKRNTKSDPLVQEAWKKNSRVC